jgi:hypothetical protein
MKIFEVEVYIIFFYLCYLLLSQAFPSWHFSGTRNDPHRSGFKLHTASHCSTFCVICDVPSIAVFCRESIESFPGIASKFFRKLLVTIPVAPFITGIVVHIIVIIIIIMFLLCIRISLWNPCLHFAEPQVFGESNSETPPYIIYFITSWSKIVNGMITRFILIDLQ